MKQNENWPSEQKTAEWRLDYAKTYLKILKEKAAQWPDEQYLQNRILEAEKDLAKAQEIYSTIMDQI